MAVDFHFDFSGKSVIVTGGAKGIGRGICLGFAGAGAHVLCADIDAAAGAELEALGAQASGEIRFHAADVSVSADCQALIDSATGAWGGVDVVCNNGAFRAVSPDKCLPVLREFSLPKLPLCLPILF